MSEHTKGPWGWFGVGMIPGDYCLRLDCLKDDQEPMLDGNILITDKSVEELGYDPLPSLADQNLIAAAPDLLEALVTIANSEDFLTADGTRDVAKIAIAKAKGQTEDSK